MAILSWSVTQARANTRREHVNRVPSDLPEPGHVDCDGWHTVLWRAEPSLECGKARPRPVLGAVAEAVLAKVMAVCTAVRARARSAYEHQR
eukprot:5128259-Pleurochrysis_carterae.AAC.1